MNGQMHTAQIPPTFLRLDTGEEEDELQEADREEKEAKKEGDEEPDYDLELQKRLNKH
jgi:hypothetical protein